MQRLADIIMAASLIALTIACSKGAGTSDFGSPSASPSASVSALPSATPTGTYAIKLQIYTNPTGSSTFTEQARCYTYVNAVTPQTSICTNTAGTATNEVVIPEGTLYFNTIGFVVTGGFSGTTSICDRVIFKPYYYRASTAAAFTPPWSTSSIDCTASPVPVGCYGGVAGEIVTDFPSYTGMYFYPTSTTPSETYTAASANSVKYGSNRRTVNNLANKAASVAFTLSTDSFVGGATNWQDYEFDCVDQYDTILYQMTLKITDQDITGVYPNASQGNSTINRFTDWDVSAWDR